MKRWYGRQYSRVNVIAGVIAILSAIALVIKWVSK